ncbi:CU044_5270 family protein [Spirillospora sp. NPDC000708]
MNDLEELGAFRAQVPEPGPERLAPGRDRLVREARSRRRVLVPAWRAGLAAGVAAAAAAAVAAVALDGTDSASPPVAARPVSATRILERAAETVAGRPDRRPAPHQWVYTRTYQAGMEGAPSAMRHLESWVRFDGRETARYDAGPGRKPRLVVSRTVRDGDAEERSPAQWYDYLRALPDDPAALLAKIDQRAASYNAENGGRLYTGEDGRDQWVFGRLADFLGQGPSTPDSRRAAVFRALARIPGVQVKEGTRDALGRPGTTVSRTGRDGERLEFVLALGTYDYLGRRIVQAEEQRLPKLPGKRGGPEIIRAGTVMNEQAVEVSAIVDGAGRRP